MAIDPNITDFIAQAVSKFGVSPTQPIDVSDPLTRLSMAVIITNIEQGRDIYSYDQFVKGSAMSSGVDPDTYNTLVNAVSLGFENFQAAGGFVSPAIPSVSSGGSSVPTNLSSYVQAAEIVAKIPSTSVNSIISATDAILAVNALNGINPLTGLANGLSAPTGVNTNNPLGDFFSGIGQKVSGAVSSVTNALGITTSTNTSAVTGAVAGTLTAGKPDVAVVGDSIAVGLVDSNKNTLGDNNPNAAYSVESGRTAAWALDEIKNNSDLRGTTNAVFSVGSNDTVAKVPIAQFTATLEQMRITSGSDNVVWVLPAQFTKKINGQEVSSQPYIDAIKAVALKYKDQTVLVSSDGKLGGDGIHPNNYTAIGNNIKLFDENPNTIPAATTTTRADQLAKDQGFYNDGPGKNPGETFVVGNRTYTVGNDGQTLIPQTTNVQNVTTTQVNIDAAKAATEIAKTNGYTQETPIADKDGKIVGWAAVNPITKDAIVFNQTTGTLKDSSGNSIKTSADLTPGLDTVLQDKGYTYAIQNANGSTTYYKPPPDYNTLNTVTIDQNGNSTLSGAAKIEVGATLAGLRIDKSLEYKTISDSASTTPIFAGSTPSASMSDTAGAISANYGSITSLGAGASIDRFGIGQFSLVGATGAQTSLNNQVDLANTQINSLIQSNQSTGYLINNYKTQLTINNEQLATITETLQTLKTTSLDEVKLAQTDALLKESNTLRDLNKEAEAIDKKIESIDQGIANNPEWSNLSLAVEKQNAVNLRAEVQLKIDESNQRLADIASGTVSVDTNGVTVATIQQQIADAQKQLDQLGSVGDLLTNKIDNANQQIAARVQDIAAIQSARNIVINANSVGSGRGDGAAEVRARLDEQITQAGLEVKSASNEIKSLTTLLGTPGLTESQKEDLQGQLDIATANYNTVKADYFNKLDQKVGLVETQGPQTPPGWQPLDSNVSNSNILVAYEANSTNAAVAISLQGPNGQLAYDSSTGNYYVNGYQTDSTGLRVSNIPTTATPTGTPVDSVDTARLLSETVPGEIYYNTTENGTTYYKDGEIVNVNGDKLADITTGDPTGGDFNQIPYGTDNVPEVQYGEDYTPYTPPVADNPVDVYSVPAGDVFTDI